MSEKLLDYDLNEIAKKLDIERDSKFKYLGIQILIDRYFIRSNGKIMESPQAFWMRVAMGLALNEDNKDLAFNILKMGGNISAVYRNNLEDLNKFGYNVVNGDNHDLRFLDKRNSIVGLKAKGKAKTDYSGFVLD